MAIKTTNDPPWVDEPYDSLFNQTSKDIKNFQFQSIHSTGVDSHNVDRLLWRHWIVSYSTLHAIRFSNSHEFNFVECGVGDGLSAFYTLREISKNPKTLNNSKLHLFDSWGPMKKQI